MSDEKDFSEFERQSKRLFDESVAGLDAATRSRLTQARHRALAERAPAAQSWRWSLVPAGTLAATALAVWFMVGQPPTTVASLPTDSLSDLEILLAEEDLELLDEEIDFYGWLEEQPEFANAGDGIG